jgi:carboxylate-amine ligase
MDALTMGVEEEFYLVDAEGDLVQEAAETVGEPGDDVDLKPEFLRSQVESGSEVQRDHATLLNDLTGLRAQLAEGARPLGARLVSSGTAIYLPSDRQGVAPGARYRRIADHVGRFVVEGATCGCHVHIGVANRDTVVAVSNQLRPWLPVLLALSANSPFHQGADTGYASSRYLLWGRWPTAGPPPYLESAEHYEHVVHGLLDSGVALDRGMIYWDIRPSEHQPTIEIRVCDAVGTPAESTLIAVLVRTLVAEALDQISHGHTAPPLSHEVLRANLWRAARDGLDGRCADPETSKLRPAFDILDELVPRCAGGRSEVDFATGVLESLRHNGGGAVRQRTAFARRGRLSDVMDLLVEQTTDNNLGPQAASA